MARQFTTTDPSGILVECHDRTWTEHVTRDHPEMIGAESWVQATIAEPIAIYQTVRHPNRRAFHRPFTFAALGRAELRVIVEYNRRRSGVLVGTVVTAFAATGPKLGEVRIWP